MAIASNIKNQITAVIRSCASCLQAQILTINKRDGQFFRLTTHTPITLTLLNQILQPSRQFAGNSIRNLPFFIY
jgi:hypothetical protein